MSTKSTDSIRAGLMWTKLRAIGDEIAGTLVKTAVSTSVGISQDFGISICDSRGRLMACGVPSTAEFTALLPRTMPMVLERFPLDSWEPGDIVISTDPWLAAGHAYDLILVTPAFATQKLIGFTVSLAHTSDIGGTLALSGAKDMYEEGLILPLLKIYKRGELNQDVLDILCANIRVPEIMLGDLHAMMAANEVGARRLVEMLEEHGLDDFVGVTDEIELYAERAVRDAIAKVPNGSYHASLEVDGLVEPVHLEMTIRVDDDSLEVDYSGSAPQLPGQSINLVMNFNFSETVTALQGILTPSIPFNEGFARAVTVIAPEGSVMNCTKPMPVKNREKVLFHIFTLVYKALHPVLPDRVLSASGPVNVVIANSFETAKGRHSNTYISQGGGQGAGEKYDGVHALHYPWGSRNIPIEIVESRAPLLITRKALRPDSGGAGRFRGGCGQETVITTSAAQKERVALTVYSDNIRFPPPGLAGGGDGAAGELVHNGRILDSDSREVLESFVFLNPGDEFRWLLAGGGGYGDPWERDTDRVAHDVKDGVVTHDAALREYGVVIDRETGDVDENATSATRRERRDGR